MKTYLILFLTILTLFANSLQAQKISFKASGQTNVAVGDQFIIQFTVNAQGNSFRGPKFEDFKILSGPNTSSNSSFSNFNGRMTQSTSITYTYYLRAQKEGCFIISPAKIKVKGKEYQTNSLKINVGKKRTVQQNQTNSSSPANTQKETGIKKDDVYIKAIINNKNPYLGEQIIITYKIYTKVPIQNFNFEEQPSFSGFWIKDLNNPNKPFTQSTEIINGTEYVTATLRKIELIPQKTGKIKITPLELSCMVQVRDSRKRKRSNSLFDSFFDDPFFNDYTTLKHFINSNTIILNVKPLPQNSIPKGFNGAVGDFRLNTSIDKILLKTNDAITLKYTISGQGNIELIEKPSINFPTDFEVYDPKIQDNIRKTNQGIIGSRTFEYLIIPRNPGEFKLDTLTFSYFNPASKKYVTQSAKAYTIQVEKSDDYQSGISYSGVNQEDIQYIGQDIHHIKTSPEKLFIRGHYFYGSLNFILAYIMPLILFILTIIVWKKKIEKLNNQSLMRHKKATKVARKNLKKANQYLGTKESSAFYNEISQALWGYLADKFNIPLSELSNDSVKDALIGKGVKENLISQFTDALSHCDYARFAPGDISSNMDKIYNEALEIISKIERELK
jgi:hypothetical protein